MERDSHRSVLHGQPMVSRSNGREADVVVEHVKSLLASGLAPADVAVITPTTAKSTRSARASPLPQRRHRRNCRRCWSRRRSESWRR